MKPIPNTGEQLSLYSPEHREAICELQKLHWSPDAEWNAEYFRWKFEQCPCLDGPLVYLVHDRQRLIGMLAESVSAWEHGSDDPPSLLPCAGDLLVDPAYRGRGLFHKLMSFTEADLTKRGYSFGLATSAGELAYILFSRVGWQPVVPYNHLRRVPSPDGPSPVGSSGPADLRKDRPFARFDDASESILPDLGLPLSIAADPLPRQMADLVQRLGPAAGMRQVRDEQYLSWRFSNPFSEYRFLFAPGDSGALDGYLVMQRPLNRNRPDCHIIDWEASSVAARRNLLEVAVKLAAAEPLTTWSASLSAETLQILRDQGFSDYNPPSRSNQYQPGLLVRRLNPAKPDLERAITNPAGWNLRMIYSDGY